ncbi:MAG: glycosyltransferase family 4 protein, partial [Anaerolineales bacterium]
GVLSLISERDQFQAATDLEQFLALVAAGTAFITFDYGIDGVSIEISKYAQSLEALVEPFGGQAIHMIGGDFYPQAARILKDEWLRHEMQGINGWAKWDDGKWFSALYQEDMPPGSRISAEMAKQIFRQAASIAKRLGKILADNQIALLIPVNIAANPGNLALILGVVMVTEALGTYVLNSSHDFYWEGGKPARERKPGETPGIRDHFFRNLDNAPFFDLFQSLYPWNGRRWLQVTINRLQSRRLVEEYGIDRERVFELSTCLSDKFFEPYHRQDVVSSRVRMAHILSDGQPILRPIPAPEHLAEIGRWMIDQRPCVLGVRAGLSVDPTSDDLIYLLQPTRVIARKRIERDLDLILALLSRSPWNEAFEAKPAKQLVLHITGPTPKEHRADLERVLQAYLKAVSALPKSIAERVFLAFSVGHEEHPSFSEKGFEPLTIETIYRMADAVVFPSEIEGRGLPIIEAGASGIPIICSPYSPQEVFAEVVGEQLPAPSRIRYTLFPEGDFSRDFLDEVAGLLLHPEAIQDVMKHNRKAVRARYSRDSLKKRFEFLLNQLRKLE